MGLDKLLEVYFQEHFTSPTQSIYHYTDSLKEILKSKCFKLSSHLDLNKKGNAELARGEKLVKDHLQCRDMKEEIRKFDLFMDKGYRVYTGSFSKGPNARLATKFNNNFFCFKNKFIKRHVKSKSPIMLGEVKYSHTEQEKIITDVFNHYDSQNSGETVILFKWLCIIIPLLKDNKFNAEKECRFISAEIIDPKTGSLLTSICPKEIKFNMNDIQYYPRLTLP